ncbi:MAG: bifunctional precorrin-2 dehydrogenase/sirohydrochlorin ferrochelatase [Magnetococcales bacterium]|nr:bifunctional precorrin-2 dehydrogenase/sirohydrochlorin ferrochelatase [Magnetococcales bacterium]
MTHYMAELILADRPVLLVGGGKVARRKLEGLLACGARVRVIAPELDPWISSRLGGALEHVAEPFDPAHLSKDEPPVLVFAATRDARLNREIARLCRERGLLCNSADDPGVSGFLVAAVVRRGPVVVGVGSGGLSPALSRLLKERLDRWLESGWGEVALLFGSKRDLVKGTLTDASQRQRFWRDAVLAVEREGRCDRTDNAPWFLARLEEARKKMSQKKTPL